MPISKEQIEDLFSVNDSIPCAVGFKLHITAVLDTQIKLRLTESDEKEISVAYSSLSDAIDAFSTIPNENALSPLHCLAVEYQKRAIQASRDDDIDAMWLSAGVCQLD